jgi:hypothetical protein
VLKRECMFCGPILIDMIDNDIEAESKDSEFGSKSLFSAADLKPATGWEII